MLYFIALQAWEKPALADFKKYIRKANKNIERPLAGRRKSDGMDNLDRIDCNSRCDSA